jgi:hypothetical protein
MDEDRTEGRTPVLARMLEIWRAFDGPPTWGALIRALGGLGESVCLIRWPVGGGEPRIELVGAQAVLAYGTLLAGRPADVLTPDRPDAAREAALALGDRHPITIEDDVGGGVAARRMARLYLPLDEQPPAVACGVVRLD